MENLLCTFHSTHLELSKNIFLFYFNIKMEKLQPDYFMIREEKEENIAMGNRI